MKPSTLVELAGFGALTYAAWQADHIAGWALAGLFAVFVGYATDDQTAAVSLARVIDPIRAKVVQRRAKRAKRRAAKG